MKVREWIWRRLGPSDAGAVTEAVADTERSDFAYIRTTKQEIESYLDGGGVWQAQGAWRGAELLAFGFLRFSVDENAIILSGGVRARWRGRGLGAELLERQLRSAQLLAGAHSLRRYGIRMYVRSGQQDLIRLVHSYGFSVHCRSIHLEKRTDVPGCGGFPYPGTEETGRYLRIQSLRPEHLPLLKRLCPDSSFGAADADFMRYFYFPWCFVAFDGFSDRPQPVGYLLASKMKEDTEDRAVIGYLEEIAVFPHSLHENIERMLISRALREIMSSGVQTVYADTGYADSQGNGEQSVFVREFGFIPTEETFIFSREQR